VHLNLIFADFLLGEDGKSGTECVGSLFHRACARARRRHIESYTLLLFAQAEQQLTKERMKDAEGQTNE
jgi:hypothetical protein